MGRDAGEEGNAMSNQEKMTFDDLIKKIEGMKRPPQFKDAFSWGLSEAVKTIKDNKEALKNYYIERYASGNFYYRTEIDGSVITIKPQHITPMLRQTGKTNMVRKILHEASYDPDNVPVIDIDLILINIEDAES